MGIATHNWYQIARLKVVLMHGTAGGLTIGDDTFISDAQ